MIRLTSLGGTYEGTKLGNGSVLVSVFRINDSSVRFLVQRCVDSDGTVKAAIHNVIVDKRPEISNLLEGENIQGAGEAKRELKIIKNMKIRQFKKPDGFIGVVEVKIEENRSEEIFALKVFSSLTTLSVSQGLWKNCKSVTKSFHQLTLFTLMGGSSNCY